MITVLIVDDHPLVRSALMRQVAALIPAAQVLAGGSAQEARQILRAGPRPNLILLDVKLPDVNGLTLLEEWRQALPEVPVIVVTGEEDVARAAEDAGAAALVHKTASEETLADAVTQVLRLQGAEGAALSARPLLETLTPRRQEVLRALVAGMSNLDIANKLGISEPTVKVHLTAIFKVLGVVSRTQAVLAARAAGW